LVVLALSQEPAETVEPYLAQLDVTSVIVGAGSTAFGSYKGIDGWEGGIPHSFLIGPDGKLAWHGHPDAVNKALLKTVLKGAKKPAGGMLGVRTDFSVDARVAKAQKLATDGKLGDAMKELDAIQADAKSSDQQKSDAKSVRDAIDTHVGALTATAESLVKAKDVVRALAVLDAVAKEVAASEEGAKAKKRAEEIRADSKLMAELEAGKAFDRLRDSVKSLSTEKAKGKFDEFAKKHAGTKAGERAKAMARGGK
jgi:hypothetical protein